MTAPVVWIPRENEGPLQAGQQWTDLTHGGPHPGRLTDRERRAYRLTFGLTIWVQALFLIALWALKAVYAGAHSPLDTVSGSVAGGVGVVMVAGGVLGYGASTAARAGDLRRAAKYTLGMIAIGMLMLGAISFDWDWINLSGSSRVGEFWYITNTIYAVQLTATLVVMLGAVIAAWRGRGGEFVFDALRMEWMYLSVAFGLMFLIDYAI